MPVGHTVQVTFARMGEPVVIMGIDPGTNVLGFGVIKVKDAQIKLVAAGSVQMQTKDTHYKKLQRVHRSMLDLIRLHHPDVVSIEAPFYGRNVQSMLKLGRAQGIAMGVALSHDIGVIEYSPRKIKHAVTGNGNASKEQVAAMLSQILQCELNQSVLDATDGLAVAVCHCFQQRGLKSHGKAYSGWKQFVAAHPGRIIQR